MVAKITNGEFACFKDHFNLISEFQCNKYFNDSNWKIFVCLCMCLLLEALSLWSNDGISLWTPCHAQRMKNILISRENWKLFFYGTNQKHLFFFLLLNNSVAFIIWLFNESKFSMTISLSFLISHWIVRIFYYVITMGKYRYFYTDMQDNE